MGESFIPFLKDHMKKIFFLIIIFVVGQRVWAAEPEQKFQGFNLQGYNEAGQKSWDVNGDTANIEGDKVNLSNVDANAYGEQKVNVTAQNGTINQTTGEMNLKKDVVVKSEQGTQMMTDSLSWDRNKGLVSTKDSVIITDKNMTVTGKGLDAQPGLKNATIHEDVAVTMNSDPKKQNSETVTITSDGPMTMDQAKSIAIFEDNVVAVSGERRLKADRMEVYFDIQQKKMKQIVCIGNVLITQGENQTYAQKAVYNADDQKVVLSGRPKMIMETQGNGFSAFGN
jgi:LPS export ABC transporter protein LptC/lipopolysaccharide transport protein LptA